MAGLAFALWPRTSLLARSSFIYHLQQLEGGGRRGYPWGILYSTVLRAVGLLSLFSLPTRAESVDGLVGMEWGKGF